MSPRTHQSCRQTCRWYTSFALLLSRSDSHAYVAKGDLWSRRRYKKGDKWITVVNFELGNEMWKLNWSTWHKHVPDRNRTHDLPHTGRAQWIETPPGVQDSCRGPIFFFFVPRSCHQCWSIHLSRYKKELIFLLSPYDIRLSARERRRSVVMCYVLHLFLLCLAVL